MRQEIITNDDNEVVLAGHAEAIRTLGKRVVRDIVEIGRRLTDAKKRCDHGDWLPWLKDEFGWAEKTARRFMDVHETFGKSDNLSDLNLPISGLYLLAAPSTPEQAQQDAIERAENGERLSVSEIKKMIEDARKADAKQVKEHLSKLEKEAKAREERIRAQYEDRLTEEQLEEKIQKALADHESEIEKYRKKYQDVMEKLKKLQKDDPTEQPESYPAPEESLWLWGRIRDFERKGLLGDDPNNIVNEMTPPMKKDVYHLLPQILSWLQQIKQPSRSKSNVKTKNGR